MRIAHASCGCDTGEVSMDVVLESPDERALDEAAVRTALAPQLAKLGVGRDNVVTINRYVAGEQGELKPWPRC